MREFLTDTSTPRRRAALIALTIILWLISIALGVIAFILIPEMAILLAVVFFGDPQQTVQTQGMANVIRILMYFCGGLALLIIFFSGFIHLERGIGSIRSMQILVGLIVVELLLILSRPVIISLLQL